MTKEQPTTPNDGGRYAACYIRESMGEDTDDSKEGQRADCRALAQRDGRNPADLIEYDDWQRSGSETAKRPAQDKLIEDMKRGNVAVIYARSMDRLMRSTRKMADFLDIARQHDVVIVTQREGKIDDSNPSAWMFVQTIMTAAEYESRVGKVRARHAVATKRRMGISIGQPCYGGRAGEDPTVVIEAFKATGTYHGAVRKLTADGVKSRRGHLPGQGWTAEAVRRIIRREAPELIPMDTTGTRGKRATQTWRFSRLLICPHDGSTLTTIPPTKPGGSVKYACRIGHRDDSHPRPYVISERYILPWAQQQMEGRMRVSKSKVTDEGLEVSISELTAKRARVIDLYVDGVIDKATRDARLATFDAELSDLDAEKRRRTTVESGIDWTAAPGEVNARLREWWKHIELGYVPADQSAPMIGRNDRGRELDLRPVRAEWRRGSRANPIPAAMDETPDHEVVVVIHPPTEDGAA